MYMNTLYSLIIIFIFKKIRNTEEINPYDCRPCSWNGVIIKDICSERKKKYKQKFEFENLI